MSLNRPGIRSRSKCSSGLAVHPPGHTLEGSRAKDTGFLFRCGHAKSPFQKSLGTPIRCRRRCGGAAGHFGRGRQREWPHRTPPSRTAPQHRQQALERTEVGLVHGTPTAPPPPGDCAITKGLTDHAVAAQSCKVLPPGPCAGASAPASPRAPGAPRPNRSCSAASGPVMASDGGGTPA